MFNGFVNGFAHISVEQPLLSIALEFTLCCAFLLTELCSGDLLMVRIYSGL
jgi:hypothetical protein